VEKNLDSGADTVYRDISDCKNYKGMEFKNGIGPTCKAEEGAPCGSHPDLAVYYMDANEKVLMKLDEKVEIKDDAAETHKGDHHHGHQRHHRRR
jgi:hypothetical protein